MSSRNMKLKFWGLAFFLWLGLLSPGYAAGSPTDPKVLHLLNRLSFGPRPGDVARVESIGIEQYIQEQLSPQSILEPLVLTNQLDNLETLHESPSDVYKQYNSPQVLPDWQLNPRQSQTVRNQMSDLAVQQADRARLLRAIESRRQLQEVMVDFWYSHFNVFADKGLDRIWLGNYEETAIRPLALGRFRDLLGANAHHPAMQFYLDNWQNRGSNNPRSRGKLQGLNENYARELMELHTLGVDGGYTQQDVIALARIFTGWGICRPTQQAADSGFCFNPKQHDMGDKVFLGTRIKGSGMAEGEQALDMLARSPATAHHISYELAQYFVTDQPPADLVNRLQDSYLKTDGDIRTVLNTLFHSPEFWDAKNYNAKFKTPYQYVVSAIRATDLPVDNFTPLTGMLQQLGMPLYGCVTPDGYKNTEATWLNPDAITRRLSFATVLASGRLPLAGGKSYSGGLMTDKVMSRPSQDSPVDPLLLATTLGDNFSQQTETAIAASPPQLRAALILGSPEFMHR